MVIVPVLSNTRVYTPKVFFFLVTSALYSNMALKIIEFGLQTTKKHDPSFE
jgi:hypothetical protein